MSCKLSQVQQKVCISVADEDLSQGLEKLKQAQAKAQIVEFRADYVRDLKVKDLEQIRLASDGRMIFTCRQEKAGGRFQGSFEEWQRIMQMASMAGFEYLDLELGYNYAVDLSQKHSQTKIMLSYHHFYETPGYRHLRKLQKRMAGYEPDLMKFATKIKTSRDVQNLIRLLVSSKRSWKVAVMGMGQRGRLTRVLAPLLGSELTFSSLEEATAPGQLSWVDQQEIYKILSEWGLLG